MEYLKEFFDLGISIYIYCTDFIINLSNLFNLSYYEINFIFFCLLYPLLFITSFLMFFMAKHRYLKLLHNQKT
jgi:hypothetical protein